MFPDPGARADPCAGQQHPAGKREMTDPSGAGNFLFFGKTEKWTGPVYGQSLQRGTPTGVDLLRTFFCFFQGFRTISKMPD